MNGPLSPSRGFGGMKTSRKVMDAVLWDVVTDESASSM